MVRLRIRLLLLVIGLIGTSTLLASSLSVTAPRVSSCPDTESVTNVVFAAGDANDRMFNLSLELDATVSNNVTLAFGTDGNTNGVLEREEVDAVIGWDSGAWFYQDRRAGDESYTPRSDGHRRLDWTLILSPLKTAKSLSATDADGAVFTNAVPPTMFDPGWDLLQVTTRGLSDPNGIVVTEVDGWGFRIILR